MKSSYSQFKSASLLVIGLVIFCLNGFNQIVWFEQNVQNSSTFCPTPATVTVDGQDNVFYGYSGPLDSVTLVAQWGDGTTDTGKFNMTGSYNYFDYEFSHTYQLPGKFKIKILPIAPTYSFFSYLSGPTDTVVNIYSTCIAADGQTFLETDTNCFIDSGNLMLQNVSILFEDSLGDVLAIGFSDSNGNYKARIPSGISNVTARVGSKALEQICPQTLTEFNSLNDTTINFGVECADENDVKVHHGFTGAEAPGETGYVSFRTVVYGCDSGSVYVTLKIDSQLIIGNQIFGPTPDSIVGQTIYWTISYPEILGATRGKQLVKTRFQIITKTNATILSNVYFKASATSSNPESNLSNNIETWNVRIDGPYDPNNKLVSPQGLGDAGKITRKQKQLIYTVNFQNTGTAPARNVFVIDSLSEYLDYSTIQIMDSSDPMKTTYFHNGVLRFDFENINLPDSTSDPEGSKGWFIFSIDQRASLPLGTEIKNFVDIYFDYNAPIRTESTINTIYRKPFVPDELIVTSNKSDVTCVNSDNGSISINVLSSHAFHSVLWNTGDTATTLEHLSPGLYSVTVTDSAAQVFKKEFTIAENRIYESPEIGVFHGPDQVHSWKPFHYTVETTGINTFEWHAKGGEVINQVANTVEVLWHAGPTGTLYVTETEEHGCYGTDSALVSITFLGVQPVTPTRFSMHPNPTEGFVEIELQEPTDQHEVRIFDAQGRLIIYNAFKSSKLHFNLGDFDAGIYMVSVSNNLGAEHQRLVVH